MKVERRQCPRLYHVLPVLVRGMNDQGEHFQFRSVLRDISAGGLCSVSPEALTIGEKLYLHVLFAHDNANPPQAPSASIHGVVMRAEERPDGTCIFAVSFLKKHIH